jgi:hypothetical protein
MVIDEQFGVGGNHKAFLCLNVDSRVYLPIISLDANLCVFTTCHRTQHWMARVYHMATTARKVTNGNAAGVHASTIR